MGQSESRGGGGCLKSLEIWNRMRGIKYLWEISNVLLKISKKYVRSFKQNVSFFKTSTVIR